MENDRERKQIKLILPAQAAYVDLARLTLYGIASRIGFSYEDIEDMKVAISEACNNAVLYAYRTTQGMVEIVFEEGRTRLASWSGRGRQLRCGQQDERLARMA